MMIYQTLIKDMIDIVYRKRGFAETFFANSVLNADAKRGVPKLLRWLFVQDFPGDTEATDFDVTFSSQQIVQLIQASPELQKYFQIKNGTLAFSDSVSNEDASEMIKLVKQNYRPQVNF